MELLDFLRARLDEDERMARVATPGPWRWGDWTPTFGTPERERQRLERAPSLGPFPAIRERDENVTGVLPSLEEPIDLDGGGQLTEQYKVNAEHIARHDPARVLAEVQAKRGILDLINQRGDDMSVYYLRRLALVYADHPDYDEAWKP